MGLPILKAIAARLLLLLPVLVSIGCELDEVILAEPEDVLIVEAYIMVGDGQDQASAFLHWTLGTRPARDLLDQGVELVLENGERVPLFPEELTECLLPGIVELVEGVCFGVGSEAEGWFEPGTRVRLEILTDDGELLQSVTQIPDSIDFFRPVVRNGCALRPGEELEFVWNRSPGVWAYSAETEITGLRNALGKAGTVVETDSVALQGVAVSDADTTIIFPREFGIFKRFDLEREVAAALQVGLPEGAIADIVIAAVDQNYVNWIRGGNFNPSGQVRVSSIRGSGVGVFGSAFRRIMLVRGGSPNYSPWDPLPSCLQRR